MLSDTPFGILASGRPIKSCDRGMDPRRLSGWLLWLVLVGICPPLSADESLRLELEQWQARRVQTGTPGEWQHFDALQTLYSGLSFQWLWTTETALSPAGQQLVEQLKSARQQGLFPEHYQMQNLTILLSAESEGVPFPRLRLELLLSDAFIGFSHDLAKGRLDPETLAKRPLTPDWPEQLVRRGWLPLPVGRDWQREASPAYPEYHRLQAALARRLDNPEPSPALSPSAVRLLKKGVQDPSVLQLREQLATLGYLTSNGSDQYDEALFAAVKDFQRRHNLEDDGQAGPITQKLVRDNLDGNAVTLAANLERWRWLPPSLGDHYVAVNVANFELEARVPGKPSLRMKTIVGRDYRKTPLFSDAIKYVVLNPSWSLPYTIASKDILPKLQANPQYLSENGMQLFRRVAGEMTRVDPALVDWKSINPRSFPFFIKQAPGDKNALGRVKFMFPNEHDVYLHDTPDKHLFERSFRAKSSGCIRLSQPIELLRYLAQDNLAVSDETLLELLELGKEKTLFFKTPIPVHLFYWTAWVDEAHQVNYRHDIYHRDLDLWSALSRLDGAALPVQQSGSQ